MNLIHRKDAAAPARIRQVGTLAGGALLAVILASGCAAPAPVVPPAAPATIRLPYALPNGEVTLVVHRAYSIGSVVTLEVETRAESGTVSGPRSARILASGIDGEVLVRVLDVRPIAATVRAGATSRVSVTWDGRDAAGDTAPADTYVVVMTFVGEWNANQEETVTASATIELADR